MLQLPRLDEVTLIRRSYVSGPEVLRITNDLGGFMFVMPTLEGRVRLKSDADLVHDGPAGPGMLRVVAPGRRSALSDVENMATVVLQVPESTVLAAGASAGLRRSGLWELPPVIGPTSEVRRLVRSFTRLQDVALDRGPALARGLTLAMLTLALGTRAAATSDRRPQGLDDAQWALAVEFACASLAFGIDLRTWAAVVGLAPAQFSTRFRERAGRSPYAWYADRRLDRAKAMLLQGDGLVDVALDLGFSSQSHFTDAFRRRVGTSPGAWVRRMRT